MDSITIRVQGESDWIESEFKIQELNALKNPTLDLPPIAAAIGRLLDIGTSTITVEKKRELEVLLSQYVSNLKIYPQMLSQRMCSLFITSYKAAGPEYGYLTRIAGALRDPISNTILLDIENPAAPTPKDVGYMLLLKVIAINPNYTKDNYHSESSCYLTLSQAKEFGDKIEIRPGGNSREN